MLATLIFPLCRCFMFLGCSFGIPCGRRAISPMFRTLFVCIIVVVCSCTIAVLLSDAPDVWLHRAWHETQLPTHIYIIYSITIIISASSLLS